MKVSRDTLLRAPAAQQLFYPHTEAGSGRSGVEHHRSKLRVEHQRVMASISSLFKHIYPHTHGVELSAARPRAQTHFGAQRGKLRHVQSSPVRFGSVLRALLDSGLAQSELATPSLALTLAGFAVFSDRPSCLCLAASSNNTLIQQEKDAKTPE